MKALQKVATGAPRLELREVAEPTLRPGHVIIDVAAAGICGTDVHIMHDEYRSEPPVTLGHEVAGTIAAIGAGVDGWELGQRVVTETYFSVCGRCEHCRTGRPNLCTSRRSIGSFEDGGFAPRLLVPATILHALPDDLGFPEAALVEPLACVVRGLLELNDVRAGDRVVITGPGPIGLLALQVAKAAGARVAMLGTAADAARLELAARLGADGVLTVESADALREAIADALGGEADVAVECSGAAPAAGLLLRLVKKAGRYVQVGLYGAPITPRPGPGLLQGAARQRQLRHHAELVVPRARAGLLGSGVARGHRRRDLRARRLGAGVRGRGGTDARQGAARTVGRPISASGTRRTGRRARRRRGWCTPTRSRRRRRSGRGARRSHRRLTPMRSSSFASRSIGASSTRSESKASHAAHPSVRCRHQPPRRDPRFRAAELQGRFGVSRTDP
jgi:L-iditol 2-dehydrogenase